jgi:CheY-like chemotaxis protein
LDQGSIFHFSLPIKIAKMNTLSEKQSDSGIIVKTKQSKTLLIAEDEDSNFMLLEELLSGLNISIIRANNGVEAVEICRSKQIDMVLMDIKMPVMDGYEATKQIKEFMPYLPIIAQTAYSTDSDKNKALDCGCIDFISKPFRQELFISKIKEHLYK